ncbi:hypothetical protein WN944_024074 [Citrus x changshan-huyou]|uniref:Cysteine-rich transmembrane CYSTM domain-containing protein n=1 Tax=Citrus x changshan-huyou TaxID=2935761 RepID=A0AAP0LMB0_9ROSI
MAKSSETENNQPPAGYPTENPPAGKGKKKCLPQTKKKGDRGFIEGCVICVNCAASLLFAAVGSVKLASKG